MNACPFAEQAFGAAMDALLLTSCQDDLLPAGDGVLPVRVYKGAARRKDAPVVMHLHGGAFTEGNLDSGELVSRLLADAGAVVVDVDYPTGLDQVFPTALKALDVLLQGLHKARARLSGKHAPVIVAGEEAGGNLAAALALMARDQGHRKLDGQILIGPMLNPCLATASLRQAEAGYGECRWMHGWRAYLGQCETGDHPYAAPANTSRLAGLVPALVLSSDDDPMRDEALAYARAMKRAGVDVHQSLIPGPSGWPLSLMKLPALAALQLPWARALRERLAEFLSLFPPAGGPRPQPA
ncbi:alpha/beta hydrolase fold domain-containing protein [Roseateles chitosanitabidus]|uniref:alpha/beta hydrolase fold domain-containing protein n=1 Tax=Roseateles chitosanitabidus TaxID=65048 RepID=UPI000834379D|nr:alpha/beta hydrolase fold domain-containing protein [Roseateles chitosanitabidus]